MAYDLRGPWSRRSPGSHSPLSFAKESLAFWKSQGVTSDKLVLGLPFYGYHFGKYKVKAFPYSQMIERDTARAFRDQVGASFYNGIPTILEKTRLAVESAGGVMIWELGLDAEDEYSLLNAISRRVNSLSMGEDSSEDLPDLLFFPNPFIDYLTIESPDVLETARLYIFDFEGRMVGFKRLSGNKWEIDGSGLPSGIYNFVLTRNGGSSTHQLIKIGR